MLFDRHRILALASLPDCLPLLVAQPQGYEDLPDVHALRPSKSEAENQPYDYFIEEIRAAYLGGHTVQYIKHLDEPQKLCFEDLNNKIMARLRDMFEKARGSWRPFCSVIALLLV